MRARSSRNSKLKKTFYSAAVFAVIIVIGMLLPRMFGFVSSVVLTPVHHVNQWFQTSDQMIPVLLRDRSELLDEIKTLESKLLEASGLSLTTLRLEDENTRLRNLLGMDSEPRIGARVIAHPNTLPYDLIQVDQGSRAGVNLNTLVYAGKDKLIGIVSFVALDYSLITLFTSPGAEMTGFISGPDVTATVEGVGGGVARVRVPQGVPITVGDLVYVPSVQPGVFGQIDYIENRPSQPEQFGYITSQVSINSLHEVAISENSFEPASVEAVFEGRSIIISDLLRAEGANTVSFETLLASSTATTTDETNNDLQ